LQARVGDACAGQVEGLELRQRGKVLEPRVGDTGEAEVEGLGLLQCGQLLEVFVLDEAGGEVDRDDRVALLLRVAGDSALELLDRLDRFRLVLAGTGGRHGQEGEGRGEQQGAGGVAHGGNSPRVSRGAGQRQINPGPGNRQPGGAPRYLPTRRTPGGGTP